MLGVFERVKTGQEDGKGVRTSVVKVIEVIGTSDKDFSDAVRGAVRAAATSLRHVSGVDVVHMTASVKDGEIVEYRANVKIAFALDEDDD